MESVINNLAQNDRLVLLIIAHVQSQERLQTFNKDTVFRFSFTKNNLFY